MLIPGYRCYTVILPTAITMNEHFCVLVQEHEGRDFSRDGNGSLYYGDGEWLYIFPLWHPVCIFNCQIFNSV
jgi:hypothetical protein